MRRTHSITASLMIITMLCLPFILAGIIFLLSDSRKKKEIHKG
jgi:prolipoprotein diacylglyceryltransferase